MSTTGKDKASEIKQRTIELYDSLPQNYEERISRLDVRDEVISINYSFFGYVASKTFINNSTVSYEDKLQSAILHFCECWWKWKWNGDETHRGYRGDISFAVFFKPRIGEMMERELNEVKYSLRRSLCMEVGEQIGKHWGQVKYEDLSDPRVHLSPEKMNSLKAIFGSLYIASLADHETYFSNDSTHESTFLVNLSSNFNTIEELLMSEMVRLERKLTNKDLVKLSDMHQISVTTLIAKLPVAEKMLYQHLQEIVEFQNIGY